MLQNKKQLFFFLLFQFNFFSSFAQKEWSLKKNENGISVYTRASENTSLKELKSSMQIKTSLSSILALLNDWPRYPEWVYRCGKSSTLKVISETEVVHYQTITTPWPVDNRDFVLNVKITQDPITKVIRQTGTCIPDFIPAIKNHVRIRELKAEWILTPLKNGSVNVEYRLLVNPGGNVPLWLVNLAVVEGPYETMLNMKTQVMAQKYQQAKLDFITEPGAAEDKK